MKLSRFFWYLFMGIYYVLLSCFVLHSTLIGMGKTVCAAFPEIAYLGTYGVGIFVFSLWGVLFVGGSYIHCFVRDKYFKEEGGVDDVDN